MTSSPEPAQPDRAYRFDTLADRAALALSVFPALWAIFGTEFHRPVIAAAFTIALALAFRNLALARRSLAGTALRPATVWAMLAILCALIAIVIDDTAPGRPRQGLFSHLAFLAVLASLVSVLGARKPGEGAWAILCGLFLAIGLLPMLEGIGLSRRFDVLDRLRSESPWTWFFVLVIIAGIGNYLLTRFGPAAMILGLGLGWHLRLVWTPDGRAEWRGESWFVLPWSMAVSIALSAILARRARHFESPVVFHQMWIPFRDAWGAAWALRVLERVNQTAARNGWPERLTWFGLIDGEPSQAPDEAGDSKLAEAARDMRALASLNVFLRRFGDAEVIRRL